MHICCFPLPIVKGNYAEHTINEEPVVLTVKSEQMGIETFRSLIVTERHRREGKADHEWRCREHTNWQCGKVCLHLRHVRVRLTLFAHHRLNQAEQALVEHEIAQPTLQALVHLSLLQLALGNAVVFSLIREKAAKLVEQGGGKRVHESAHHGMGQGYHPLSFRPQAL